MIHDLADMPDANPNVTNGQRSVSEQLVYFGYYQEPVGNQVRTVCCIDHGAMNCVAVLRDGQGKLWRCATCNEGAWQSPDVPWEPARLSGHWRNHLISRPKNYHGTRYQQRHRYPCWCGDSLVERYRAMNTCCLIELGTLKRFRPVLTAVVQTPDPTDPWREHWTYVIQHVNVNGPETGP